MTGTVPLEQLKDLSYEQLKQLGEALESQIKFGRQRVEEEKEDIVRLGKRYTEAQTFLYQAKGKQKPEAKSVEISENELAEIDIDKTKIQLKDAEQFVLVLLSRRNQPDSVGEEQLDHLENLLGQLRTKASQVFKTENNRRFLIGKIREAEERLKHTQTRRDNFIKRSQPVPAEVEKILADANKYMAERLNRFSELTVGVQDLKEDFSLLYRDIITFEPVRELYEQVAEKEISGILPESKLDKATEEHPLSDSRENIDRAKVMIYLEEYLDKYKKGEAVDMPKFFRLRELYNIETGKIDPENFPEFFSQLTGLDINLIEELKNEVEVDKYRELLVKHHIKTLDEAEKLALQEELMRESEQSEEKESKTKRWRDSLSTREDEEQEDETAADKLNKMRKRSLALAKAKTDPHIRGGVIERRAKQLSEIGEKIEKGQVWSILDLAKLESLEPRTEIRKEIKEFVKDKARRGGEALKNKALDKLGESQIGNRIKAKGYQISTFAVKVKRKKKEAKEQGKGLLGFIIKKMFGQIFDKVTDVAKQGARYVRATRPVQSIGNWFNTSGVGQRIQSITSGSVKLVKDIAEVPTTVKNGLIERAGSVYKVVDSRILTPVVKPIIRIGMDVGYVGKTFVGKTPLGLVYGVGASVIASALGVPAAALLPVFIASGVTGQALATIDHIMHTPTVRVMRGPIRWLQSQGSALFRDPKTGVVTQAIFDKSFPANKLFSLLEENAQLKDLVLKGGNLDDLIAKNPVFGEILERNPELRQILEGSDPIKRLSKLVRVNTNGTTFGRIFSATRGSLAPALVIGTIASFFGINPLLATGVTFAGMSGAKYYLSTTRGAEAYKRLLAGTYSGKWLTRLAALPATRIFFHLQNAYIVNRLVQELANELRASTDKSAAFSKFFRDNFTFGGENGNIFQTLGVFINYASLYGYASTAGLLGRLSFSTFSKYLSTGATEGLFAKAGPGVVSSFLNLFRFASGGAFAARFALFMTAIRGAMSMALPILASSLLGLGFAAALGIPIGGIGATIGAAAGGLIGMAIGGFLGAGAFSIPLAAVGNFIGTTIGAWIGSLFDKAADKFIGQLFGAVGAIGFLFTLIDAFYNGLSFKRMTTLAITFALTAPAITAMADKGEQATSQANSTLPTPTVAVAVLNGQKQAKNVKLINNTRYELSETQILKLRNMLVESASAEGKKIYLVISESKVSTINVNDEYLIATVSFQETDPEGKLAELLNTVALR